MGERNAEYLERGHTEATSGVQVADGVIFTFAEPFSVADSEIVAAP